MDQGVEQQENPAVSEPSKTISEVLPSSIGNLKFRRDMVLLPAIMLTYERYDPKFFEETRRQYEPDGYIFGAGAGNIFTMVEAFKEGTNPKGLIMVDIDPAVILAGKILIRGFRNYANWEEFVKGVFYRANDRAEEVINGENDEKLKKLMSSNMNRFKEGLKYLQASKLGITEAHGLDITGKEHEFPFDDELAFYNYELVPMAMMARHYELFRKLALEGNMGIVYADMFDPELLQIVANLPGEKTSNNIVYTTNIGAISARQEYGPRRARNQTRRAETLNKTFKQLSNLDPEPGNKNVYISYEPIGGPGQGSHLVSMVEPPQY